MKQKKPSSLARILGYAGGHKNLTILGCILSALSAVLGLAPYLCVWLVARSVLSAWPSLDGAGDLGRDMGGHEGGKVKQDAANGSPHRHPAPAAQIPGPVQTGPG